MSARSLEFAAAEDGMVPAAARMALFGSAAAEQIFPAGGRSLMLGARGLEAPAPGVGVGVDLGLALARDRPGEAVGGSGSRR
jgi:hypothetical protein